MLAQSQSSPGAGPVQRTPVAIMPVRGNRAPGPPEPARILAGLISRRPNCRPDRPLFSDAQGHDFWSGNHPVRKALTPGAKWTFFGHASERRTRPKTGTIHA